MSRARVTFLAVVVGLWGVVAPWAAGQASRPSGAWPITRAQALQMQAAAARAAAVAGPRMMGSAVFIPAVPPFDRAVNSLEWMTASSGAVFVGRFQFLFIDTPRDPWASVLVEDLIKG